MFSIFKLGKPQLEFVKLLPQGEEGGSTANLPQEGRPQVQAHHHLEIGKKVG